MCLRFCAHEDTKPRGQTINLPAPYDFPREQIYSERTLHTMTNHGKQKHNAYYKDAHIIMDSAFKLHLASTDPTQ